MLRWLTAGESHGEALVGIVDGMPAGVKVTSEILRAALARRRLGYGRGARMSFEQDQVRIVGGVRHGLTLGSPVVIEVGNTEWPKWEQVMNPDPVPEQKLAGLARNAPLTRPRPGHADLPGMVKYGHDEARPVLERASARETACRTALGTVAAQLLRQVAGIELVSHTVALGHVVVPEDAPLPGPGDMAAVDADPLRCHHQPTSTEMVAAVDAAKKNGDTLGGVAEVIAYGVPVGLGTYAQWDRRLDAALAGALMSIQAIKAVEVGDGLATARRPGSAAHDEITPSPDGVRRITNRAGGIEGGMSNGEPIRVRAAMKPISTVPRALATVDIATGKTVTAHHQRSDVCAVPAAAVVAEAMVALVLADALLTKCGGDHVIECERNLTAYVQSAPEVLPWLGPAVVDPREDPF